MSGINLPSDGNTLNATMKQKVVSEFVVFNSCFRFIFSEMKEEDKNRDPNDVIVSQFCE